MKFKNKYLFERVLIPPSAIVKACDRLKISCCNISKLFLNLDFMTGLRIATICGTAAMLRES